MVIRYVMLIAVAWSIALRAGAQPEEVLKLINEVRTDPQTFLQARLLPYLKEHEMEDNSYAKSLIDNLRTARKINPLQASPLLEKTARSHAMDMGSKGTMGHDSSNGTSFVNRVRKKIKGGMIAENCDYGNSDPIDIVMSLLIDDGIASLGHRKNLLHPQLNWIGIAIEKHKTYGTNCVMDFASSI